ncbi:MAG: glycosyltransferase [Nitrospiraceae bacterium]
MKQALFVAYYFPPIAATGAMRPLGFCRHLPTYGWHPAVLTTTPESVYPPHPVDHHLETYVPQDVRVEHVGYRDSLTRLIEARERTRSFVSRRFFARSRSKMPVMSDSPRTDAVVEPRSIVKDAVLDWLFAFPDRQASWISPAVRRITDLTQHAMPDIVIATGGPWSNFVVGRTLARRLKCPLILDYRDPWTCNPYYAFSADFLTERARRLEKSICLEAARVITNTEELRQRLCAEYPEISHKCVAIPNGFDPEILGMGSINQVESEPTAKGYELCHFGTVYGKRTPRVLLRAVWELYQEGLIKPEQLRLRFVGAWESTDEKCNNLAEILEKHAMLARMPPVSHQTCVRQMKEASVLLIVQPESPLQIPGKIYEYIAVGRPLFLVGGEGATAGLVERHNLGISCPNEVNELKEALRNIIAGLIPLRRPDSQAVNRFAYRRLAGELAQLLDAAMTETASDKERPVRRE